jgi:hypothetical protein
MRTTSQIRNRVGDRNTYIATSLWKSGTKFGEFSPTYVLSDCLHQAVFNYNFVVLFMEVDFFTNSSGHPGGNASFRISLYT